MVVPVRPTRRGVIGWSAGVLALGGCGFRPLYGTVGESAEVRERLSEINVLLMPERSGQLMRQALISRLQRGGTGVARRFDLAVQYSLAGEAIAIQPDNSTSRVRLIGTARWTLTAQDGQRRTVTSGAVREVDGYNIINQQFFASELTSNAVQERIANALAEQITMQLALHFSRQTSG